jgi:hypothetical protein
MAQNCMRSDGSIQAIPIAYLAPDSDFKAGALPRGQTIFGTPNKLFRVIAENSKMLMTYGPEGLFMGRMDGSGSAEPDVIYAPPLTEGQTQPTSNGSVRYCLLGTPEQQPEGVSFRVLLDSRLRYQVPCLQAQLKNAVINQLPFQYGQFPSILTQDGVYFVSQVRHIGDTRGPQWESQVLGINSVAGLNALLGE